jgi:hypothetical protein
MWGRYWLHFSDLTNRKETPPFSPAGPHIRRGLLDPTSFQKLRFWHRQHVAYDVIVTVKSWCLRRLQRFIHTRTLYCIRNKNVHRELWAQQSAPSTYAEVLTLANSNRVGSKIRPLCPSCNLYQQILFLACMLSSTEYTHQNITAYLLVVSWYSGKGDLLFICLA